MSAPAPSSVGAPAASSRTIYPSPLAYNLRRVRHLRTITSAGAGAVAGLLGLTGLWGLALLFAASLAMSLTIRIQTGTTAMTLGSDFRAVAGSPAAANSHGSSQLSLYEAVASGSLAFFLKRRDAHILAADAVNTLITFILFWTITYALVHIY
ncbi:hypothetical protein H696_05176 [Fonticula alba]|uniref:ER membrane protein complex subunit 6 n=1 Tax=Fonticula alba TaxID=691883 RepID=A0A058Z2U0_FONAL|nr:hypothetical protein H696_05176 [Fonticula alba]KCV68253.1 hypothetical protein H696_05176 [Fonticula alba]|eukprot:XP_009497307.1 hypothetical protein H696_05176 [Fonticula alba]